MQGGRKGLLIVMRWRHTSCARNYFSRITFYPGWSSCRWDPFYWNEQVYQSYSVSPETENLNIFPESEEEGRKEENPYCGKKRGERDGMEWMGWADNFCWTTTSNSNFQKFHLADWQATRARENLHGIYIRLRHAWVQIKAIICVPKKRNKSNRNRYLKVRSMQIQKALCNYTTFFGNDTHSAIFFVGGPQEGRSEKAPIFERARFSSFSRKK